MIFSVVELYRPPLPFPSRAKVNLVKQGNIEFMKHKELKEQLEKEVNYSKPLMSMQMIFKVFAFTRPPIQVTKTVEEKEEKNDKPHFDKKNPKRYNTKARDTGMKKEPKRMNIEDVNPKMLESLIKAFNRQVGYKRARFKMMENREVTLPPDAT
ncbi:unnamed protein product [Lactuca saligna]|uniref:Uncharacterized protein n=1 Tax=Lactuca saligna TaxID=75948 RepID=A0AA35ZW19_LACSI|nr:unnamed protein product [Lactuca saligna]